MKNKKLRLKDNIKIYIIEFIMVFSLTTLIYITVIAKTIECDNSCYSEEVLR